MVKVTIWFRLDKNGYEHNHVEIGWASGMTPTPISDTQKGFWKGSKWLKYLAYQDGMKLVEKTLQC